MIRVYLISGANGTSGAIFICFAKSSQRKSWRQQMNQMASCDFLEDQAENVPGIFQAGKEHDEFYEDEDT